MGLPLTKIQGLPSTKSGTRNQHHGFYWFTHNYYTGFYKANP